MPLWSPFPLGVGVGGPLTCFSPKLTGCHFHDYGNVLAVSLLILSSWLLWSYLPMEKLTWQVTQGLQPTSRKELKLLVQQPTKNYILPTTTWAWKWMLLRGDPRPSYFTAATYKSRGRSSATPGFLTHGNCEMTNMCCSKPLQLW